MRNVKTTYAKELVLRQYSDLTKYDVRQFRITQVFWGPMHCFHKNIIIENNDYN